MGNSLMLGKIDDKRRRRGQQRMRWLDGIIDSMDIIELTPGDREGRTGKLSVLQITGSQRVGHD